MTHSIGEVRLAFLQAIYPGTVWLDFCNYKSITTPTLSFSHNEKLPLNNLTIVLEKFHDSEIYHVYRNGYVEGVKANFSLYTLESLFDYLINAIDALNKSLGTSNREKLAIDADIRVNHNELGHFTDLTPIKIDELCIGYQTVKNNKTYLFLNPAFNDSDVTGIFLFKDKQNVRILYHSPLGPEDLDYIHVYETLDSGLMMNFIHNSTFAKAKKIRAASVNSDLLTLIKTVQKDFRTYRVYQSKQTNSFYFTEETYD